MALLKNPYQSTKVSALLIITNLNFLGHILPQIVADCGVVLFGGVHIFMPQNISNNVDIVCFMIEVCAKGGAKFVRRNLF